MGWLEFFTGPVSSPDSKRGDYRPQSDYAEVSDRAITPDNRSTPGLYYSGDLVRAVEKNGLVVTRENVEEVKAMADSMQQNEQNLNEFSEELKRLATHETGCVKTFSQLKPAIAKQHAYQNREHNKLLHGLDGAAVEYQKTRQKRAQGSQQTLGALAQMQQQQRKMLRGG